MGFCSSRRDVLDDLVTLHNFRNQFLPNALREFFRHIHAPEERGEYLETLITKFSHRFCACNPDLMRELGLSPGKQKWVVDQSLYFWMMLLFLIALKLAPKCVYLKVQNWKILLKILFSWKKTQKTWRFFFQLISLVYLHGIFLPFLYVLWAFFFSEVPLAEFYTLNIWPCG